MYRGVGGGAWDYERARTGQLLSGLLKDKDEGAQGSTIKRERELEREDRREREREKGNGQGRRTRLEASIKLGSEEPVPFFIVSRHCTLDLGTTWTVFTPSWTHPCACVLVVTFVYGAFRPTLFTS